jgi:hypothetical protein
MLLLHASLSCNYCGQAHATQASPRLLTLLTLLHRSSNLGAAVSAVTLMLNNPASTCWQLEGCPRLLPLSLTVAGDHDILSCM